MSQTNDFDEPKPNPKTDEDILQQARGHYKLCVDNDSENRILAVEDLRFLSGGEAQWDARAVAQRKADGRPIITVNQLPAFLHQVTNDQRMNTPSIKVHPVGSGADEESAKIRQGLIRHIEYDSNADIAYDRAVNSAAAIGAGYFYLDTDYESPTSFDQKIKFCSVRNHLSVRVDPMSISPDGSSDMNFCFIESLVNRNDFLREYPDASANNNSWLADETYSDWLKEDTVLVCRYYYIEMEKATVVEMSDGATGWKDTLPALPDGITIKREREGWRRTTKLCKITGVDVLEKTEIQCQWIPVFSVYGDENDIEGKVIRNGIIRHAKGPAQSFNVMISGATEEVSLRTKAPYIGAVGQFEGMEDDWAQANNRAFPYLEYNPVEVNGTLAPQPQRQPMADVPSGMLALMQVAGENVKKTTGLFDASLGQRGTATSGKQELAQQREGDVSNYHFSDNLNRAVLQAGRCINDMIPSYYDAERVVQIMRPDDTMEDATINQQLPEPQIDRKTGTIKAVLNDMTGGEFSVTVSAGPSYTTMRQESQEFFTSAMQAAKDPATNAIVTYLAMRNSDAPGADEATKMLKTLLPPPAQQVIDDKKDGEQQEMIQTPKGPLAPQQVPQVLMQLEQQIMQMQEALQKAQTDKQAADAAKAQATVMEQQNRAQELALDQERVKIEQFNAETERLRLQEEATHNHEQAIIDASAQEVEQRRIESERAVAEQDKAQKAAEKEEKEAKGGTTLEDIAQLIKSSRGGGMTITSKNSGAVYDVKME